MRITAVSYLNTLPFIYGIEQRVGVSASASRRYPAGAGAVPSWADGDPIDLSLRVPALCAEAAVEGKTDIALVPTAAIPLIPGFSSNNSFGGDRSSSPDRFTPQIITDFCIGAEGAVETVVLLSDTPLTDVRRIYLDAHSRTSVQLARILAREHWRIEPLWVDAADCPETLRPGEAMVAIGDKVFALKARHRYAICFDLAEEWRVFTGGLPFVFAAWVACSPAGLAFAPKLNEALAYGVEHIAEAISRTLHRSRDFDFQPAFEYLTRAIKFNLDTQKREAMRLFWEKIISPG